MMVLKTFDLGSKIVWPISRWVSPLSITMLRANPPLFFIAAANSLVSFTACGRSAVTYRKKGG